VKPFTGLPAADDAEGCAFSAALDQPTCGQPNTVHIASDASGWGLVSFAACTLHAGIARAAAIPLTEHPYTARCDTGLCWADMEVDL